MDLEDYLNKRFTKDDKADELESNMRSLLKVGIEPDPMHLEYVKINRLERMVESLQQKLNEK